MGWHVLIVEDNVDGANTMAAYLKMCGIDVQVAYDGESAVALAVANPPDAVLCDINLPKIDGFEVARQLRSALPDPPLLVAITARSERDLVKQAGESGFDHYFLKPADPVEVGGLLSDHLGTRSRGLARVPVPPK